MTSLLTPFAALLVMGSSPLAFQADYSFAAPAAPPAWLVVGSSQSAPVTSVSPAEVGAEPEPKAELQLAQAEAEELQPPQTVAAPAPATPAPSTSGEISSSDRSAILRAAATSLSDAVTAKGRFTQVGPDGSVTQGDFALRRPGRMRFDYDDPTPILIVSDGSTVAMEDTDLETVDRVPLASTPLGLILDDELNFETEARVTDVRRTDSEVSVAIEDRSGESEGQLTLYFDASNYELLSWRAVDANRQVTRVALQDIKTNVNVDPRLFRLDDPADEDDER